VSNPPLSYEEYILALYSTPGLKKNRLESPTDADNAKHDAPRATDTDTTPERAESEQASSSSLDPGPAVGPLPDRDDDCPSL